MASAPPVAATPITTTGSEEPVSEPTTVPDDQTQRDAVLAAIQSGVKKANARGGTSGAAVWVDGWEGPATAGYAGAYRLWSTSKPLTAIGVLDRQTAPDPQVDGAMHDALVKSSNCGQRRMVIELQGLSGGIPQAMSAFNGVALKSGITDLTPAQQGPPTDTTCDSYLQQHGVTDAQVDTALFGTGGMDHRGRRFFRQESWRGNIRIQWRNGPGAVEATQGDERRPRRGRIGQDGIELGSWKHVSR